MRNLLLWPLLVAALGAPINSLLPFAALLLGTLLLVLAAPRTASSRGAAAVGLMVIGAAAWLAAPPAIEEGMNAFFPGYPQDAALKQDLPQPFYDRSLQLFDEAHPPVGPPLWPCSVELPYMRNLLKGEGSGAQRFSRAYAFSADGLWSGARFSRQVTAVEFNNIADLRAGFVNDLRYYWVRRCADFVRTRMAFVVRYDLPVRYSGSEMCWTGTVMLQDGQGLRDLSSTGPQCTTLAFEAGAPSVFGMAVKGIDLRLKITPPTWIRLWDEGLRAVRIGAALLILLVFFRVPAVPLALSAVSVIASLALIDRYDPDRHVYRYPFGPTVDASLHPVSASNFGKYRVLPIDMDGYHHVAYARSVLWAVRHGDFREAFRGSEDVYIYMPGMRYLEAATLAVFGDSEFGPIFYAGLTAVCLFYFLATFATATTALVLCAAFLFGPKLLTQPFLLDLDLWLHLYFGHWADGASTLAFLTGAAILVRLAVGRIVPTLGALAVPGLLISLAVFLRANYGLAALAVMACSLWFLRPTVAPSRLVIVAAGFAFIGTAALHNWVFGGVLVPFTGDVEENLPAAPGLWLKAAIRLPGLLPNGTDMARAALIGHLDTWLGDLANPEFIWLRMAALLLLPALLAVRRLRTPANVTLLAIIVGAQLPLLFFLNTGRYGLVAWPCTLLGAVLVLQAAAVSAVDAVRRSRSIRAVPSR